MSTRITSCPAAVRACKRWLSEAKGLSVKCRRRSAGVGSESLVVKSNFLFCWQFCRRVCIALGLLVKNFADDCTHLVERKWLDQVAVHTLELAHQPVGRVTKGGDHNH